VEEEDNMQLLTANWARSYNQDPTSEEYKDLTQTLSRKFIVWRIAGLIVGEMGDRDGELILKQLQSDNQKLAEQLSQSYIPPKDPVVGTT
jgi:lipoprotein NlpI